MCSTILVGGVSILMGKFSSQFQNEKLSTLHIHLPHQTDVLNYPSGGGSILMCMGKEGVVLITMHSNKSGVRFLFYLF